MSNVFCANVQYKVKPGKAQEYTRGMDATQGRFYRQQPGCIAYVFGLDSKDKNMVLGTAIWSSKELFEPLPRNLQDLEKLDAARGPYRAMLENSPRESMSVCQSKVTFGKTESDDGVAQDLGWDAIMGSDLFVADGHPRRTLTTVQVIQRN